MSLSARSSRDSVPLLMNGKETVMPRDTLNLTPANNSEFEPCYGVRYHKLKEVREDGIPSHPHTLACNLELRMASFAHSKRQARGPPAAVTELFPSRSHDSPNPCYSKGTHTQRFGSGGPNIHGFQNFFAWLWAWAVIGFVYHQPTECQHKALA